MTDNRCQNDLILYHEDYIGEDEQFVDSTFHVYCDLEEGHLGLHSGIAEDTGYDGKDGPKKVYWE